MAIVGRVRGGLAMVAVVAEVLFSGISGFTAADVSAISSLLVPAMKRAGYSGAESVSVVAAASAMGILVPPCLTMVVLGSLVNLSIVTLFLAGFVPAFVLAAALLVLIGLRARRQQWPLSPPASKSDFWRAVRRAAIPSGLPILLFGGIFSGLTTVTEAALLAVVYALVAGLAMSGVRRSEAVTQLAQSGIVTATTLWVLAAASAFAWILVREWVPQTLGEWIAAAGAGRRSSWHSPSCSSSSSERSSKGCRRSSSLARSCSRLPARSGRPRPLRNRDRSRRWASHSFSRRSASACQSPPASRRWTSTTSVRKLRAVSRRATGRPRADRGVPWLTLVLPQLFLDTRADGALPPEGGRQAMFRSIFIRRTKIV